jgi:hypothetical protein
MDLTAVLTLLRQKSNGLAVPMQRSHVHVGFTASYRVHVAPLRNMRVDQCPEILILPLAPLPKLMESGKFVAG